MTKNEATYHSLLVEYASGCLDEAHALVVATHMALSPTARKYVAQYESIGGSMLNDCCTPVAMKADALASVMDKLESIERPKTTACGAKKKISSDELAIPECLDHYIETRVWNAAPHGTQTLHVKTTCSGSKAQLMKIAAGQSVAPHTHKTKEVTLVLKGGFRDGADNYGRGDLIVLERGVTHALVADVNEGCVCFVVRPSASPIHDLLNQVMAYFKAK